MEVAFDSRRLGDTRARLEVEDGGGVSGESELKFSRLRQLRAGYKI
jgi:hypothetical protein